MIQRLEEDNMQDIRAFASDVKKHLTEKIIPFWKSLRDDEYGGYYGWVDYDLKLDRKAVKGCILNSRILWFFSNAYLLLGEKDLLREAAHAFRFLKDYCVDRENGGVFWCPISRSATPKRVSSPVYVKEFILSCLL